MTYTYLAIDALSPCAGCGCEFVGGSGFYRVRVSACATESGISAENIAALRAIDDPDTVAARISGTGDALNFCDGCAQTPAVLARILRDLPLLVFGAARLSDEEGDAQ
jgi:hypothetical protein